MTCQNMPDRVSVFIQGIVDVEHSTSGESEYGVDSLLLETRDNNLSSVQLHAIISIGRTRSSGALVQSVTLLSVCEHCTCGSTGNLFCISTQIAGGYRWLRSTPESLPSFELIIVYK